MAWFDFSGICLVMYILNTKELHTQLQTRLRLNNTLIIQENKSSEQLFSITFNLFHYEISRYLTVSTVTNFSSSNIRSNRQEWNLELEILCNNYTNVHCATSPKVTLLRPDGMNDFFQFT
jgi:hypothetical protein